MEGTLDDILQNVNLILGVVGSFVCSEDGETLASAPTRLFGRRALALVGRLTSQTIAGLRTSQKTRSVELSLAYANWQLLIKSLRGGCLCILCLPGVNRPLVRMAADSAAKEIASTLRR